MRFIIFGLLLAISYAQTGHFFSPRQTNSWRSNPGQNYGHYYTPMQTNTWNNRGSNIGTNYVQRPWQSSQPKEHFPWSDIEDFVHRMATGESEPKAEEHPNYNTYSQQQGQGYYGSQSNQPNYDRGYDSYPSNSYYQQPQQNDYTNPQDAQNTWKQPNPQNQWSPQRNQPQGGYGGGRPQRAVNQIPPELQQTACAAYVTPSECFAEECMWTKNRQFEVCVGEGTPCEFISEQQVCTQVGEGEMCQWDMQGKFCFGELTPCHKRYSQQACVAGESSCQYDPSGDCFDDTTPCKFLRHEPSCNAVESCHFDIRFRRCMDGEAPEMLLQSSHRVDKEAKSSSNSNVSQAVLGGLVGCSAALIFIGAFFYSMPKKATPKEAILLGDVSTI